MAVEYDEFKGHKMIKLIVENMEAIKKFAEEE